MTRVEGKKGVKKLAKELEVSRQTIKNTRKKLGKRGEIADEEEIEQIRNAVGMNATIKRRNEENLSNLYEANATFKPNVRRIDERVNSSVTDMLQDAKERYVKNEELIQRLQFEIDNMDVLMNGNSNGTVSSIPQLATIERFIKSNIALRNQIVEFEKLLGRTSEDEEDDPFA